MSSLYGHNGAVELSTNLREVSQDPENVNIMIYSFSLLKNNMLHRHSNTESRSEIRRMLVKIDGLAKILKLKPKN